MFIKSWHGDSIFHILFCIVRCVYMCHFQVKFNFSLHYFPLLHICVFNSSCLFYLYCCVFFCPVTCLIFTHYYLFSLSLGVYSCVAPLCIPSSRLCLWTCACRRVFASLSLCSAASRSSPCLDHDNSRWYSLFWLLYFVSLLFFPPSTALKQTSHPPFSRLHDFIRHDFTFYCSLL